MKTNIINFRMKSLTFCLIFIYTFHFSPGQTQSERQQLPERIMLTVPGDPATTAAVTWRTIFSDTVSIGQIAEAGSTPYPEKDKATRKIAGKSSPWETGSNTGMGHRVIFNNLKPSTSYIYRVGNGEVWSEWFSFSTASDKPEPLSFLYFGDVQSDIKSQCSRLFRNAYSHFPGSGFMIFAGDLVDRSVDERWDQFFQAGGWILGTIPSLPTPGNHEYNSIPNSSKRTFSSHWQQIFTMPANSPSEELSSRVYYTDYQGVRLISLDSPAIGYTESDSTLIITWLEKVLSSGQNKWKIVFTHYPVYSCSQGRDNEEYRAAVQPLIEKYGVDLVLQGHDHTYCRGQNSANAGKDHKNLPVYVVSVAGAKMYGLNSSLWADRVASETQLYQHITIDNNKLYYKSFTIAGELYDAFEISKNSKGINKIKESPEIKEVAERITIPESRRSSYKPEELKKIEARTVKH